MKTRTAVVFAVLLAALLLPELAAACPMCVAGQGGNQKWFAVGSLFLSITPLVSIGGMVWYLRRRARALAADEAAAADSSAALPAATGGRS